jgi:hypothetical protein
VNIEGATSTSTSTNDTAATTITTTANEHQQIQNELQVQQPTLLINEQLLNPINPISCKSKNDNDSNSLSNKSVVSCQRQQQYVRVPKVPTRRTTVRRQRTD